MRYFDYLTENERQSVFYSPPEEFHRDDKKEIVESYGEKFYEEDKNSLFLTEEILQIIKTDQAQMTTDEYMKFMHPEDRTPYLQIIKKISKKYPEFVQKYL